MACRGAVATSFFSLFGVVVLADVLCLHRTLAENVALFEQAGLELVHVHPLRRLVSVMELKKRA